MGERMVATTEEIRGKIDQGGKKDSTTEPIGEWEVLSPEPVASGDPFKLNPHPSTLVGKTVVLRKNHKPNSDKFLDRVAELMSDAVKAVRVIKAWEVVPGSDVEYPKPEILKKIAELRPDLVISAQGD